MERHRTDAPEQATRRSPRRRPPYHPRHLLGLAIGCAMARSSGELWSSHHLLQPLRSLALGWCWDQIMDFVATAYAAAVQVIDTRDRGRASARCIAGNSEQHMGRSRGGLTSKIHAVVDADGLPVRLGLTPGEAHDNRLCSVLLTELQRRTTLLADRGYDADWIREFASQRGAWANIPPKRNRKEPICFSPYLTEPVTWSSASSTSSSNAGGSPPAMTSSPPTISPSSISHQSGYGCALMGPRPKPP